MPDNTEERDNLFNDSDLYNAVNDNNDKDNISKDDLKGSVVNSGFTTTHTKSVKKQEIEQLNFKCIKGMSEVIREIVYHQKIKKKDLIVDAISAYIQQNKLESAQKILEEIRKAQ